MVPVYQKVVAHMKQNTLVLRAFVHVRKKVDMARTVSAFLSCTLVAVISLRPRRDQRCTINNGHVYTTGKHRGTNDLDLGTKVQLAGSRLGSDHNYSFECIA